MDCPDEHETLVGSFRRACRRDGARVAWVYADTSDHAAHLTYADLLLRSETIARGLLHAGLSRGDRVADFCDDGAALPLGFLGIALAGGVIVPLERQAPAHRLLELIVDSGARMAVCAACFLPQLQQKLEKVPGAHRCEVISLEEATQLAHDTTHPITLPIPLAQWESHLIYTSGSTGTPKGVVCSHGALRAFGYAKVEAHRMSADSRVLVTSAHTWDPCITDAFSTLATGATLCAAARPLLLMHLFAVIEELGITHVCATPSLWAMQQTDPSHLPPTLKVVALGGEAFPLAMANGLSSEILLLNTYGTTEGTGYQTVGEVRARDGESGMAMAGWPLPGTALALRRLDGGGVGGAVGGAVGRAVGGGVEGGGDEGGARTRPSSRPSKS